jgi:hypothetical protein
MGNGKPETLKKLVVQSRGDEVTLDHRSGGSVEMILVTTA